MAIHKAKDSSLHGTKASMLKRNAEIEAKSQWTRDEVFISIRERVPPAHQKVLAWVCDTSVAIECEPVVAWLDDSGLWWAGLPQSYINLRDERWTVSPWKPFI